MRSKCDSSLQLSPFHRRYLQALAIFVVLISSKLVSDYFSEQLYHSAALDNITPSVAEKTSEKFQEIGLKRR